MSRTTWPAAWLTWWVPLYLEDTGDGGVSNEATQAAAATRAAAGGQREYSLAKDRRTRIVKAQLGNRAGLIGAALLEKRNKRI